MRFDDYERGGWSDYAAFSEAVAGILRSAIGADAGFRLQQVRSRAKTPASLRRKLEERGQQREVDLVAADELEVEIKDLAGCRVIFYTNTDVAKLINSGMIETNFEVVEVKIHHPRRDAEDAAELYVSNHYLVRLRPERLALAEYARFEGLRCEIQIQTILNHAWAEMAHDTIYKRPDLENFGSRALASIEERLKKVARKYLLPAGYEFAKVAADYERLMRGGELFKAQTLDAIVDAPDNNVRAEALETFSESVLPLYDDLRAEFSDIMSTMVEAAARAHATPPVPRETPYGELPPMTALDVVRGAVKVVSRLWLVDPAVAFDALLGIYSAATDEAERKLIVEAAAEAAKHDIHIWRRAGPAAQGALVDRIAELSEGARRSGLLPIAKVLGAALGSEVGGHTNHGRTVEIHRGPVQASAELTRIRRSAVNILKGLFRLADSDEDRAAVLHAMRAGTRPPIGSGYGPDLVRDLMEVAAELLEFEAANIARMDWELLAREERVALEQLRIIRNLSADILAIDGVPALAERTTAAIAAFRAAVDADREFAVFKVLIGFDRTYPHAWDEDRYDWRRDEAYREAEVDRLIERLSLGVAADWDARLRRFASVRSSDLGTFPILSRFLSLAAERRPEVALQWLDGIEAPLSNFIPAMLSGLQKGGRAHEAAALAAQWIGAGLHLADVALWCGRADPYDEGLLKAALDKAIDLDDRLALRLALVSACRRFAADPGRLREDVFLRGLSRLHAAGDLSWVQECGYLADEILGALDEPQAERVLEAMVCLAEIDHSAAAIVAGIARRWPAAAMRFFGRRLSLPRDARPRNFDAIPFTLSDQLRAALAEHPDVVLGEVGAWFDENNGFFQNGGGRLVAEVYRDLEAPLPAKLGALIGEGRRGVALTLAVLNSFAGIPAIDPLIRLAVARLDPDDDLIREAGTAMEQTEVVMGEFGFVEEWEGRLERVRVWADDVDPKVRAFAAEMISYFQRRILSETRRAEASAAAFNLEYGGEADTAQN